MARTPIYHVRWAIRRDMSEVMAIELASFEFPWQEDDFIQVLRQRHCIGMVAEGPRDKIVGFVIYELHKSRLHLLNLAVDPQCRRNGVGRAMIAKLIGKLSAKRRGTIACEVREKNLPAQLFFRALGFEATRVLREFYDDTPEDAYLLEYTLPECRRRADEAGAIPRLLSERQQWND